MKTHEELEAMANKVRDLCSSGISSNIDSAIQLLDDLHSDGLRDAAKIADDNETSSPAAYNMIIKIRDDILSAVEAKEKQT